MGLQRASVRLSDVFVMAPALTEAKQSDNFSEDTHSRPAALDANSSDSDRRTSLKGCSMCLDKKPTMTKSQNGHEIKNEQFENLNTLAFASEIVKVNNSNLYKDICDVSERGSNMSNWIPSMDEKYTMGLQKTGIACLLKDKSVPNVSDMEGIIQNFGTDLNSADLSQEFMQVLSNIDQGVPQNSDVGTMSPGNDIAGGMSNFYRDLLLNEVDVLGMSEQIDESVVSSDEMKTQADLLDVEKEQRRLERRHDFLLRRLSKLQIRGIGRHLGGEVAGLLEHTHRAVRQAAQEAKPDDKVSENVRTVRTGESGSGPLPSPETDQVEPKGVSATSMKNLVHKLEKARTVSSNALHRNKCNMRYFGSGSAEVSASVVNSGVLVPPLAQEPREELERTSGLLHAEVNMMRRQVDSDATASSSGAESCDEMQNFNNPHQQYCSIAKRASWKWAQDRAAIASRWIWLQWQISDLEYRIRQLNELQKQIRISKGPVLLEEETRDGTAASSSSTSSMTPSCSVNGHRLDAPGRSTETWINGTSVSAGAVQVVNSDSNSCSRTKQFVIGVFRKRRLLATTGLHITSKKCRPSTIRCNCSMGLAPCALCTGRSDPTFPKESGDLTTIYEQVAYLDPGFHAKISFPKNISHIFHFNAIIKMPEWQQKTIRNIHKQLKITSKSTTEKKDAREQRTSLKRSEQYRKYRKLLRRRSTNALTTNHKQQLAEVAMAQLQALSADDPDKDGEDISASGSKRPSPVSSPQPVGLDRLAARDYRRNRVDSYDIDNIVIPYSVAASTRVEKLPYKEILTPKWRVVDEDSNSSQFKNGLIRNPVEDSDVEDVDDDLIVARHEKCEIEEKRKFMSYIKFPLSGSRSRANRRTDSRTESSGANTPDPMSPHTSETMDVINSPPITPSTATAPPPPHHHHHHHHHHQSDEMPPATMLNLTGTLRRRTASQSRWIKDRDVVVRDHDPRCTTPESIDVQPYESRVFPLADEDYDKMLRAMPSGHPMNSAESGGGGGGGGGGANKGADGVGAGVAMPPMSPESDSTSNSVLAEEDPNDPEWIGGEGGGRDRTKR